MKVHRHGTAPGENFRLECYHSRRRVLAFPLILTATNPYMPPWSSSSSMLPAPSAAAATGEDAAAAAAAALDDWADRICAWTPRDFREAVKQSGGKFLYRGDDSDRGEDREGIIECPTPDLLVPGTYGDGKEGEEALAFFACLENYMSSLNQPEASSHDSCSLSQSHQVGKVRALPSNGHIGTSDQAEAVKWGPTISVWPVGDQLSYVWPRQRQTFIPEGSCSNEWESDLVVDQNLADALMGQNREVLFASSFQDTSTWSHLFKSCSVSAVAAYISIPSTHDKALREALENQNYGLLNYN